jgi:hypothetical protein
MKYCKECDRDFHKSKKTASHVRTDI